MPKWGVFFACFLLLAITANASIITPSNLIDYKGDIFSYDIQNSLIKRSIDGHEYWRLEGPFKFDSVKVNHGVISLLHQDQSLHSFGEKYGDLLLTIDDSIASFKPYLSYILYFTTDNELVIVDSQTGFEFWRKKFINSNDFFFYSAIGQVAVKQKNRLSFYSVLTGVKSGDITLPNHKGTFFEFVNSLLFLSNNTLYELEGSNFKRIKDFNRSTVLSKFDQRYITYKSKSGKNVYVYDIVLKKDIFEHEIEDLKFINISSAKLCLVSKLNIMLFNLDQEKPLLESPLTSDMHNQEILSCIIKGKEVALYSKTEIQRFKLP